MLGVDVGTSNGIVVLSPADGSARGNRPCDGVINRFCVVTVRLDGVSLGAKSTSFTVRVADVANPSQVDIVGPFTASATVQTAPTILDNHFTTVSVRLKAQQAGVTPLQYLLNEYTKIKPTSFVVDPALDIHSTAESDALIFDRYANPWDSVDWKNNWTNSVFDFSSSAWDSYGGTAPDYNGPDSPGGAAITRCHIATAKHYPRGGGFMFHKRTGEANWYSIVASAELPSSDIRIYRIEPCLPPEHPVYALLDPTDLESGVNISGAPYFGNHYDKVNFIRRASIEQISGIFSSSISGAGTLLAPTSMQVQPQVGDSGSPTFIYFDGKLVLMSTYSYGGWGSGPFYGARAIQQELQAALDSMNPNGSP